MAIELQQQVNISIPTPFIPLTAEAREAPIWEDGSQHYYTFTQDADAVAIDEDGNPIPQDKLHLYGHERKKFYIFYGGRGGGKSESLALISVIYKSMKESYIILCCREIQSSIKDSLYQTLNEWIENLGYDMAFDFTEHEIRCKTTGSKFIFRGLRTNSQEIKSMKGVGLCIVDEAVNVSRESWRFLIPTLRLENSEFWIAFNTGTPDDYTFKRFVTNADERCHVCKVNIADNPLAPKTLFDEMESSRKYAEKTGDWDDFNNTWLGEPLTARDGGVFRPEMIKIVPVSPVCVRFVRGWDLASSAVSEKNNDPDWTVGAKVGVTADGQYVIADIVRLRDTPDIIERALSQTATLDGIGVEQSIPQDPGQAGKSQVLYLIKKMAGFIIHFSPESGSKVTRAQPFASQVNVGNVVMVAGDWNDVVLNEMKRFNGSDKNKDDCVDALGRAFQRLLAPYNMQQVEVRGL